MITFGSRLSELREKAGYSQKEFASLIKVDGSKYNKWENDKNRPDFETVCNLATILRASTDYLLGNQSTSKNDSVIINTGLSDRAIERLISLKENGNGLSDIVNGIIASEDFDRFIALISLMLDKEEIASLTKALSEDYTFIDKKTGKEAESDSEVMQIYKSSVTQEATIRLLEARVTDEFLNLIRPLYKQDR